MGKVYTSLTDYAAHENNIRTNTNDFSYENVENVIENWKQRIKDSYEAGTNGVTSAEIRDHMLDALDNVDYRYSDVNNPDVLDQTELLSYAAVMRNLEQSYADNYITEDQYNAYMDKMLNAETFDAFMKDDAAALEIVNEISGNMPYVYESTYEYMTDNIDPMFEDGANANEIGSPEHDYVMQTLADSLDNGVLDQDKYDEIRGYFMKDFDEGEGANDSYMSSAEMTVFAQTLKMINDSPMPDDMKGKYNKLILENYEAYAADNQTLMLTNINNIEDSIFRVEKDAAEAVEVDTMTQEAEATEPETPDPYAQFYNIPGASTAVAIDNLNKDKAAEMLNDDVTMEELKEQGYDVDAISEAAAEIKAMEYQQQQQAESVEVDTESVENEDDPVAGIDDGNPTETESEAESETEPGYNPNLDMTLDDQYDTTVRDEKRENQPVFDTYSFKNVEIDRDEIKTVVKDITTPRGLDDASALEHFAGYVTDETAQEMIDKLKKDYPDMVDMSLEDAKMLRMLEAAGQIDADDISEYAQSPTEQRSDYMINQVTEWLDNPDAVNKDIITANLGIQTMLGEQGGSGSTLDILDMQSLDTMLGSTEDNHVNTFFYDNMTAASLYNVNVMLEQMAENGEITEDQYLDACESWEARTLNMAALSNEIQERTAALGALKADFEHDYPGKTPEGSMKEFCESQGWDYEEFMNAMKNPEVYNEEGEHNKNAYRKLLVNGEFPQDTPDEYKDAYEYLTLENAAGSTPEEQEEVQDLWREALTEGIDAFRDVLNKSVMGQKILMVCNNFVHKEPLNGTLFQEIWDMEQGDVPTDTYLLKKDPPSSDPPSSEPPSSEPPSSEPPSSEPPSSEPPSSEPPSSEPPSSEPPSSEPPSSEPPSSEPPSSEPPSSEPPSSEPPSSEPPSSEPPSSEPPSSEPPSSEPPYVGASQDENNIVPSSEDWGLDDDNGLFNEDITEDHSEPESTNNDISTTDYTNEDQPVYDPNEPDDYDEEIDMDDIGEYDPEDHTTDVASTPESVADISNERESTADFDLNNVPGDWF